MLVATLMVLGAVVAIEMDGLETIGTGWSRVGGWRSRVGIRLKVVATVVDLWVVRPVCEGVERRLQARMREGVVERALEEASAGLLRELGSIKVESFEWQRKVLGRSSSVE